MKAAVYARVSREEQVTGLSLDTQVADARAYAEARGYDVVQVFVDEGVSGGLRSRPALDEAVEAAKRGEYEVLLVRHVDRLTRDAGHALELSTHLARLGVEVVPFGESDVPTERDRFMYGIRALVAEQERARTRERMMRGKQEAAARGKWHGGESPYGTRPEPAPDGRGSVLVRDETEAQVVRNIYTWMTDERLGPHQVAKRLNEQGVTTRRGKTWSRQLLKHMLKNPRLMGTAQWYGETVDVPQLLTRTEWLQVQNIFDSNARKFRPRSGARHSYPLSGRVFDPEGHHWIGGWRKEKRWYHCSRHPGCDWKVRRWIQADELETLVLEDLRRNDPIGDGSGWRHPRMLAMLTAFEVTSGPPPDPDTLRAARSRVEALEERLANLYVLGSDLDAAALKKATSVLQADLDVAREDLRQRESRQLQHEITVEWQGEVMQRVDDFIKSGDLEQVAMLLGLEVHLTGDLKFDLKADPTPEMIRKHGLL